MATKKAAEEPSMEALLRDLPHQKHLLDSLDDQIAKRIERLELALRHAVGIRVEILMEDDGDDQSLLVFGKYGGEWLLTIERQKINGHGDSYVAGHTPLMNCSRQARANAFADGWLEKLIRTAEERFRSEIVKRKEALAEADRLLSAVSFPIPEKPETEPSGPDDDIPF